MTEPLPAVDVQSVNWVRQVDGKLALSLTAAGTTLGFVFDPQQAEQLFEGVMAALPQQPDEAPAIALSPGLPAELDVEDVEVSETERHGQRLQMHLRAGEHGVQIRVGLREAIRWQRRLAAEIGRLVRRSTN